MVAKKADFAADLFYIDNEGYEGHVQVTADDVDTLFANLDDAREKAKNRGFKPREQRKGNTYVKVEPKKYEPAATAPTAMENAANDAGFGKACPVCDTQMDYVATKRDGSPLPFGPFWACPKCQKKINAKQRGERNEIPF